MRDLLFLRRAVVKGAGCAFRIIFQSNRICFICGYPLGNKFGRALLQFAVWRGKNVQQVRHQPTLLSFETAHSPRFFDLYCPSGIGNLFYNEVSLMADIDPSMHKDRLFYAPLSINHFWGT